MAIIQEFQGANRWLSNFATVSVEFEGKVYPSVEHGFVAAKSLDEEFREYCTNPNIHPAEVKSAGKKMELRGDWEQVKHEIMFTLLESKFTKEPFKTKLIESKYDYIQEGNWWSDTHWGFCFKTQQGENVLGKMIMKIRTELLENL